MQQIGELVCSQNHNKPVCSVIIEKQVKKEERLLCQECMMNFQQNIQIKGISIIQEMVEMKLKENNEKKYQFLSQKKQEIESLTDNLHIVKSKLIVNFDQILGVLKNWIDHLAKESQINNTYSLIDEYEKLLNSDSHEKELMQFIEEIINKNNDAIEKILSKIIKLKDVFSEAISTIKNSLQKIMKIPKTDIQLTLITSSMLCNCIQQNWVDYGFRLWQRYKIMEFQQWRNERKINIVIPQINYKLFNIQQIN